ncbi:MAG: hypothetical protein ACYCRH_11025 [Acidiferrobacteraceae bacterium]
MKIFIIEGSTGKTPIGNNLARRLSGELRSGEPQIQAGPVLAAPIDPARQEPMAHSRARIAGLRELLKTPDTQYTRALFLRFGTHLRQRIKS